MADAVTSVTIYQDAKKAIMKFTNTSDGTGESAVAKVDVSTLSPAASNVRITKIWYSTAGMSVNILEDASTDVLLFTIGTGVYGYFDFSDFGGIPITKAAGYTGDILFTTVGHTAGDTYFIILEVEKY
jgi:hypothetical protein